jgi:hypothetical protein
MTIRIRGEFLTQLRACRRGRHQAIQQGPQIQAAAGHQQCLLPTLRNIRQHGFGSLRKLRRSADFRWGQQIYQVVPDLTALGWCRLRRSNVHIPVQLSRIDVDDFRIEQACQRQGEGSFSHRRGANQDN